MTLLTERVLAYQKTGENLQRLVDQISILVYQFPREQPGFTEEDGAEFLLRFMPRIRGLIERYQEEGPFESYLAATLRWQVKTFAAERSSGRIRLTTLEHAGLAPLLDDRDPEQLLLEAREEELAYGAPAPPSAGTACLLPGQARRLLFVSLKMGERLGESDYRRLACAVGCDPEWLILRWHQLRAACETQRERRRVYRTRRDRAWFRMRCVQYRMTVTVDGDTLRALAGELLEWRHRYEQARKVLLRMQDGPSHAQIARALCIPKGTVDSGMYYAKREITREAYRARLALALENA